MSPRAVGRGRSSRGAHTPLSTVNTLPPTTGGRTGW
ncbi:hypothetical protein SFR_1038 [Streptomyces sp. FR-008]|nr:hypothetical protein SFR_1038 [Streptomyces sp. FR-008]